MSRIRVLLVDDEPYFCWDKGEEQAPTLPQPYAEHFELTWIQNAQEARWAMETFELISRQYPERLSAIGWPPEIVVFDYALTKGGRETREESDPTNICSRLRKIMADRCLEYGFDGPDHRDAPPETAPLGADRTGFYVGSALARTFSLHPCGAVPTTAKVDTSGTDAEFYQWLNRRYFYDFFKDKARPSPEWKDLLKAGAWAARERIIELAEAALIQIELADVLELKREAAAMKGGTIRLVSRYGRRELPIAGLFVDYLLSNRDEDQAEFSKAASNWATSLLEVQWQHTGNRA